VDAPGSAHSFRSVHSESGEQFFAAPEEYFAQGGIANAGSVSRDRELDGGRNPLASPLKPGDESRRTRTGAGGESVADHPPRDPALHCKYSGGLGLPGHLVISTSMGGWRQMPAMSLTIVPCNHRWTDNVLVPEVPEHCRPEILRDLGVIEPPPATNAETRADRIRLLLPNRRN
jgi:hypothetical protein